MSGLIVEDGTGKTTANSYISLANAEIYIAAYVYSTTVWDAKTDDEKDKALKMATAYIENEYREKWKGYRSNDDQALAYPRYDVYDEDDYLIESDTVPTVLANATAELATRTISGDIMGDLAEPGDIKSKTVKVGPITKSVEFAGSNQPYTAYRKIDAMLAGLLQAANVVERG